MALCATAMGTAACVLNENWAIDDYVYISIYGLEGIFLFSKSQILKNFLLHSKKAKKLKSFITSFLLWETHIKYSTSWETNNLLYSYTVWTDLQRKFDSFLSVLGVHCHQCYLFKRSTYYMQHIICTAKLEFTIFCRAVLQLHASLRVKWIYGIL